MRIPYNFLSRVKKLAARLEDTIAPGKVIIGAGVVAILIRRLLEFVSRLHWALGALLATLLTVAAIWLTRQVKRASRDADSKGVLGVLVVGLFTIAVVGAWISFTLHESGIGSYSVPVRYSAGTFFDLYMYTFLDLLPGIEVLKTLHLKAAIESQNFVAALPILGFTLFVVWLFFDAFLSWWKTKQDVPSALRVRRDTQEGLGRD